MSLAVAATPALAVEIPVFVVAGQSNAVGYKTDVTKLSAAQAATQSNVLFLGDPSVSWFHQWYPPTYQKMILEWRPLTPPTQIGQTWYGQPERGGQGAFGPEISIGKTISDARGGQLVAEVKLAAINTSLYQAWNPHTDGSLYSQMRTRVVDSLARLPTDSPGDTGKVAGFFWMQGERDAGENRTTAQYQADLTDFIAHVRSDFGDPNLPFIFGRISTGWGDGHSVREAQANVAATVPHTFMMDTDGLETFQGAAWSVGGSSGYDPADPGHFSNQGTIDMGIGFANGYLSITPEPSTLVLLAMGALGFLAWAWRQRRS